MFVSAPMLAALSLLSTEQKLGIYTRTVHTFTAPYQPDNGGYRMTFALHNMDANSTLLALNSSKLWNGTWSAPPPKTIDNDFSGRAVLGFSAQIGVESKTPGINGSVTYIAPANVTASHQVGLGFAAIVQDHQRAAVFVVEAVYRTADGPLLPHVAMVGDEFTYTLVFARGPNGPSTSKNRIATPKEEMPMPVARMSELRDVPTKASNQRSLTRLEPDVAIHDPSSSSWRNVGPAAEDVISLNVILRLETAATAGLERALYAVSDPQSPEYGQHFTKAQIRDVLQVPQAKVDRVQAYFMRHGALETTVSPFNDIIRVRASAARFESALSTTLSRFVHAAQPDVSIVRASAPYALPDSIAADVALVGELLQFPALRASAQTDRLQTDRLRVIPGNWSNDCNGTKRGLKQCVGLATPAVLAQRYRVPYKESTPGDGRSSMAVAEFVHQYFRKEDNAAFSTACGVNVSVAHVHGAGDHPGRVGVEAQLDIEYIAAMAQGVQLSVIYSDSYSLLGWANNVTSMDEPPLVHSVSYGNDEKQQSGAAYMDAVNTAFAKAGTMGLSILFASGDQGVCGREGCGRWYHEKRFKPDFPGGSPFHTSVGGTDFVIPKHGGIAIGEEMAWSESGGGFSDHFPIPKYQAEAVAAFKNRSAAEGKLPEAFLWNQTGRGYPDVAALGGQRSPYCVSAGNHFEPVSGTSASTPVVAGIVARLNGLRLAAGKPPLGFLNPFIYQHAASGAFHDVTKGDNPGPRATAIDDGALVETSDVVKPAAPSELDLEAHLAPSSVWPPKRIASFTATEGWDPTSGVGTLNYEVLAKLVLA